MTCVRCLLALLVCTMALAAIPIASQDSAAQEQSMSYTETADYVLIETGEMNIAVSKNFPAVIVAPADPEDQLGYGLVISSALGYNATPEGMLVLEDVPYHASFEHATWALSDVLPESNDELGETITVELTSSVSMNKKNPGSPGNIIIDDWADVTVRFHVTSEDYSARYEGVSESPDYSVNGTTELKFDITMDINEAIDAQNLSLDMGLMKTDGYIFSPTSMPEQYVLHGYQGDGIIECDPLLNETDGDIQLLHKFLPRDDFKQLFTFVEEGTAESYFGWAKQAELSYDDLEDELIDLATYYRTDGDSLRLYLSTPMDVTTISVLHDPSMGLFGGDGGYVDLPDDGLTVGSSSEAVAIGVVIGAMAIGAVGAYAVARRKEAEDPGETLSLEKNRYYRKKL
ncbi:MAG: hypothetical protein OEM29_04135 [Thermoplasmata archaeon]|nr:hypothetical protein [Thermoplasmata archaeon]